ncbi:MAG: LysR family transcriptional regulator [Lachnospiraceae bacterium]
MDTLSFYYFSEVAKDLHITKTANRLFITQQTLSNHILRLEEHFGVKLLHRKPTLALTYTGEQVLQFAEKINRESSNLKDIITEIQNEDKGVILFGASILRMTTLLPDILPVLSTKFPNVETRIIDGYSPQLEEMVLRGELDIAIMIPTESHPKIVETSLMLDQIYLCMTDSLLERYYGNKTEELKEKSKDGADLKNFSKLPFCILKNRFGNAISKCFEESGFTPKAYTSNTYVQINEFICFSGLAASFSTRTSLHNLRGRIPADLNIFPLIYKGKPISLQTNLVYHKDRYLCNYNRYFFDLISNYFQRLEQLPIDKLVTTGLKNYYSAGSG